MTNMQLPRRHEHVLISIPLQVLQTKSISPSGLVERYVVLVQ